MVCDHLFQMLPAAHDADGHLECGCPPCLQCFVIEGVTAFHKEHAIPAQGHSSSQECSLPRQTPEFTYTRSVSLHQQSISVEWPHQVAGVLHPVQHKEPLQGPGGGDTLKELHSPWQRHNSHCMHTCNKAAEGRVMSGMLSTTRCGPGVSSSSSHLQSL